MPDDTTPPTEPTHDVQEPLEELPDFVDNPDPRAPCVLLVDTSGSMSGPPIAELNAGLAAFRESLTGDEVARRRVEPAIVAFHERAELVRDFATAEDFEAPTLTPGGRTDMGAGIELALDTLEARKQAYRDHEVPYYRPWIFLITDGRPTDPDAFEVARARLVQAQRDRKVLFFAVGVAEADTEVLAQLSPERPPLRLHGLEFREMFAWLSRSMTRVSQSRMGDDVRLEPPGWGSVES